MPENSQSACRLTMRDLERAMAFLAFLGKPSAEEYREQIACPLSVRNPSIPTWMTFCGSIEGIRRVRTQHKTNEIVANIAIPPPHDRGLRFFGCRTGVKRRLPATT